MLEIVPERPEDAARIEDLLDQVFGAGRKTSKTVYRLRQGARPLMSLCFSAQQGGRLLGSLRFWPVTIGGRWPALLLGPVAVAPGHRGLGIGARLIGHGLGAARRRGHAIVVLVGEEGYYRRFGFGHALARALDLPGPVERRRLLAAELVPRALAGVAGLLEPRSRLRQGCALGALAAPRQHQPAQHQQQHQPRRQERGLLDPGDPVLAVGAQPDPAAAARVSARAGAPDVGQAVLR